MNSKNCFAIVIGAIVVLALLVIVFSACVQKVTSGKLKVTASINQVNVIFDDKNYTTPFERDNVKGGDYSLTAYKEGYKIKKIPITISAGKTTEINIELEEDPIDKEIIEGAPPRLK